jgi:hypothetical protein
MMRQLAFAVVVLMSTPSWAMYPTPTPPPVVPVTVSTTPWWRVGLRHIAPILAFVVFYELCKMHEDAVAAENAAKK